MLVQLLLLHCCTVCACALLALAAVVALWLPVPTHCCWHYCCLFRHGLPHCSPGAAHLALVRCARLCSGYANGSYEQVCGEGHRIVGDAVVPLGRWVLLEKLR